MSQDFIRALKAPLDPPVPTGPLKIDIARSCWDNTSFHVPRKEEVITDWILTKFHKDATSVLDSRMWELLADVLTKPQAALKTWLPPILNRDSISTAVISLFSQKDPEMDSVDVLYRNICRCLGILWPLSVRKLNTETLLECFGASLSAVKRVGHNEDIVKMVFWITKSFRTSLSNSSNKKKIYTTFTQTYLPQWISALDVEPVEEVLYDAGIDVLFSLDMLRHQMNEKESTLFTSLHGAPLGVLPRLFSSFITATKGCRGALFGASSHQSQGGLEDVRVAAVGFFVSAQGFMQAQKGRVEYWYTQRDLLQIIKDQSLFNGQQELEDVCRTIIDYALVALNNCSTDDDWSRASAAAQTLAIISSTEFALIYSSLARILRRLQQISSSESSFSNLLENITQYHIKTRTVTSFLSIILEDVSVLDPLPTGEDPQDVLTLIMASPLMRPDFLNHLGIAVQTFTTSTQILPTLRLVIETVTSRCDEIMSSQDSLLSHLKALKKNTTIPTAPVQGVALGLAVTCRVATVVLCAVSSVDQPAIREEFEVTIRQFYGTISSILTKQMKFFNKWATVGFKALWDTNIVITTLLRLTYSIRGAHSLLGEASNEKLVQRLVEFLSDKERSLLFPELTFEALRTLLSLIQYLSTEEAVACAQRTMESLDYFSREPDKSSDLKLLLNALVERWLPLLDFVSTKEQMKILVRVLVEHDSFCSNVPLQHCLSSAAFWEMERVRDCLSVFVDEATSSLQGNSKDLNSSGVCAIVNIFNLLLFFPPGYTSRQLNNILRQRAMVADEVITTAEDLSGEHASHSLTILRAFTSRTLSHSDSLNCSANQAYDFVNYLMRTKGADASLISATVELANLYISILLTPKSHPYLEKLCVKLASLSFESLDTYDIHLHCLASLVTSLSKNHKANSFSVVVLEAIRKLHNALMFSLHPVMLSILSDGDGASTQTLSCLGAWCNMLTLGRWLEERPDSIILGPKLCLLISRTSKDKISGAFVDTTFSILKEEILSFEVGRKAQLLDILVEAYTSVGDYGTNIIDNVFKEVNYSLTVEEFTRILKVLEAKMTSSPAVLSKTVALATIIVQEAPKDTFQITQAFVSISLSAFGNGGPFMDPSVRSHVFRFVQYRCRDRASTLRSLDLNSIWSLIDKFLWSSHTHEVHTSVNVFHEIVAIMTALIRLRRDLVIQTLPHIAQLLRKMILLMRRPKPQLGGKQTAVISNAFPFWIHIHKPLDVEEARALARLLETLTTKTIVKTYVLSNEPSRAESLAKPFSKHAGSVLTAYIDVVNDPLCVVPISIRKELQPGLFALCDMVNEHDRNALMVASLDAGGKFVLKSLWKDYEKQRYIGKG